MKRKRLLQSITAIIMVLFTLFGSMAVMAAPLAETVTEMTESAEKDEQETFIYPEEKTSEEETITAVVDEKLRKPDVAKQTEEDEYGTPVVVSEHSKIYQTGNDTFKTVYSEIPNTFKEKGKQKEYDNTLVLKNK